MLWNWLGIVGTKKEDALNNIVLPIKNVFGAETRQTVKKHVITKALYLRRDVTIHNQSGKKAWIILSPTPIYGIGSLSIDQVGEVSFTCAGDYKFQQSPLSNGSTRTYDLDTANIYYSVFFECDDKWKVHFKDVKINTSEYDINLLPKHIDEAVNVDITPLQQNK